MFSPSTRSHYLNITPNNVVRVYCKESDGKLSTDETSSFKPDDFVVPVSKPASKPHILSSPNAGKDLLVVKMYISDLMQYFTLCVLWPLLTLNHYFRISRKSTKHKTVCLDHYWRIQIPSPQCPSS